MKNPFIFLFTIISFGMFISCTPNNDSFDKQAHRGGRGLMPENTIIAHKKAIDFGTTLEMDLQMSKDKRIVVSHDAYFNSLFCLTPNSKEIPKNQEQNHLLYRMSYDTIGQYDCGSKAHPNFPDQKNIEAAKPLLEHLIDSVEAYAKTRNYENHYNIEIKTNPAWDGKHYSSLEEFVDSVVAIIQRKEIDSRTMIQSFDTRALKRVHKK